MKLCNFNWLRNQNHIQSVAKQVNVPVIVSQNIRGTYFVLFILILFPKMSNIKICKYI